MRFTIKETSGGRYIVVTTEKVYDPHSGHILYEADEIVPDTVTIDKGHAERICDNLNYIYRDRT